MIDWLQNKRCNEKKSLKIPKGEEESVNQRRTDNTMAKKEKDKQLSTKYYT
jgi:hypothetical protein